MVDIWQAASSFLLFIILGIIVLLSLSLLLLLLVYAARYKGVHLQFMRLTEQLLIQLHSRSFCTP
jgi:hypothetical protein